MIKFCEVRLIKMNITNFESRKLLNMDGRPGKFYLDGFAPHEFVKLANLISNYGGLVISPDDETIILSKTDRPSEMNCFPHFHVNWLHCSLSENKLQDIGKYLLPKHPHAAPRMSPDTAFQIRQISKELKQIAASPQSSPNEHHERCQRIPKRKDLQLHPSPNIRTMDKTKGGKLMVPSPQRVPHDQNILKQIMKNESENVPITEDQERSSQEQKENKQAKKQKRKKRPTEPKSVREESEQKKNSNKKPRANDDNDAGNCFNPATAPITAESPGVNIDGNLTDEGQRYVPEENKFDDSIGETSFTKKKDKHSLKEKDRTKRTSKSYSYDENLKIFRYLADNHLLSKANRDFVWEMMAGSEVFQDPPRSASGLRQHFHRYLLPNYLEYTTDSNIIAELTKIQTRKLKNIIGYFNVHEHDDGNTSDSILSNC